MYNNFQYFFLKKYIYVLGQQAPDKNKWQKAAAKPLVIMSHKASIVDGKKPHYVYLIHSSQLQWFAFTTHIYSVSCCSPHL